MKKYIPILVIIGANIFYHISTKSTNPDMNPFASLIITYTLCILTCFVLYYVTSDRRCFREEIPMMNWATFVLGACLAFLEYGNIMMYKIGWDISIGSLIYNIALAIVLIAIGVIFYRDRMTKRKLAGVALCVAGLILLNV